MKSLTGTFAARQLERLSSAVFHHPRLFFYPQAILFLVSALYTIGHLEFDTSRSNLVGPNKKYQHNYLEFKKEFPSPDDLVVVVESEDSEKNRQFVERLGAKLEAETNLFRDVFFKGDLKMMGSKALLFVPEKDLGELQQTLKSYRPFIEQFTRATNLTTLFSLVNTRFRTAKREQNSENDSLVKALPALERIVREATGSLRRQGAPPSPGVNALFGDGEQAEQQIYITFNNGRIFLVTAHAPTDELNSVVVERLQKLVEQTRREVPGLNVGITGEPVLEHDEMLQSQKDTTLASIVSLVICALIFIYGYQETGRPIKATICLVVGLVYTLGFATLAVGHLNILTITFVPMLIGLAIDFGVHLITRYEEELRHGRSEEEALRKAMVFTGQGIFTGAFTTAGAFLAMGFTDFKGIQEMGIICGGGLLICLVPMMTLLPVLLLRGRQNVIDHQHANAPETRARLEKLWLERPVFVVALTVALCGLALTQFHKVRFDYDLLNMQSEGLPAVVYERKLIASADKSVLFCAVLAHSETDAVALEARIKSLPTNIVAGVESLTRFLSEDSEKKLRTIGEIKHDLASIIVAEPDPRPVEILELSRTLWSLQGYLGLASDEVKATEPELNHQLLSLRAAIGELRKGMLADEQRAAQKLAAYQWALFTDVRDTFEALRSQDNQGGLTARDLPEALRNRFVGVTGKHLLQVYPKKDVWERENQREFIQVLREGLDPHQTDTPIITGTPVQLYEYTGLLKTSYQEAAWYALAAIAVLVFVHFRSLTSVLLALLPVLIGSVWMGGLMGYFDIPFNPANIMTLPLVIGIGVTNGIHILNRFAEERSPSILAKSTGKAVLISGLTTIAGFGSLILAKHQGIESLGWLMAGGVATCMIAGLTFLPALLILLLRRGAKKKQPSADNA